MLIRTWAIAAFALAGFVGPALAQETPAEDPPAAAEAAPAADAPPQGAAPTACPPRRKGPGLGALLAAANQAGAGDLLTGRSGAMFGSGRGGGSVAGAVLGTAINAAGSQGPGGDYGAPTTPGAFGSRKAQAAAVAAGTVIGLAKAQAQAKAAPCGGR